LLYRAKTEANSDIMIRPLTDGPLCVVSWGDAAWANRPDGASTGGTIIGVANEAELASGQLTSINIISWKSHKLKRKSRSSTAAEIQAICDVEDEAMFIRLMLASFEGYNCSNEDLREVALTSMPGYIITDSKSFYDSLRSASGSLGMEEKRSALEMMDFRERTNNKHTHVRWVHSEANLADSLTKAAATAQLQEFLIDCKWALTKDPLQQSSRKRKEQGLSKFEIRQQKETRDIQPG
jgi:hypothetical protein